MASQPGPIKLLQMMPIGRMASQPGPIKLLQKTPVADLFRTSPTLLVDQAGPAAPSEQAAFLALPYGPVLCFPGCR
ncbi:hypothetical protein WJX79_002080 [Trebouxia sp. C0005]